MNAIINISTINVPTNVRSIARNLAKHKHAKDAKIVVTGDVKTPQCVGDYLGEVGQSTGVDIEYLDLGRQRMFLEPFPEIAAFLPINSIARKNLGNLMAVRNLADMVILMDDDVEITEDSGDFLAAHWGALQMHDSLIGAGFFSPSSAFSHRGMPVDRPLATPESLHTSLFSQVRINEGLCMGEGDEDATTRLELPAPFLHRADLLEDVAVSGCYCPVNGQNTAFHRDLLPFLFLTPDIGRSDDIWMGYAMCRAMQAKGHAVRYGSPLVGHFQWRSQASILQDILDEMPAMQMHGAFCDALSRVELDSEDSYEAMAKAIAGRLQDSEHEIFRAFGIGLGVWLNTLDSL